MARRTRLKFGNPERGYYHVVTRTVLKSFLLDDAGKEEFMRILRKLSQVYFVKVVTFALMSNHIHLIVRMQPEEKFSDEELADRLHFYYNSGKPKKDWRIIYPDEYPGYRARFGDLSRFVQDLKQRFSRWYNRGNNNHGSIWGERFISVMLEPGRALTACMAYVELNAVRAGIVERPEDYRWCGLSHYVTGGRAASWLDHETFAKKMWWRVEEHDKMHETTEAMSISELERRRSMVKRYLALVYYAGNVDRSGKAGLSDELVESAIGEDFASVGILSSLDRRMRPFSHGVFLGSKAFCGEMFNELRDHFVTKKERSGYPVFPCRAAVPGGLLDIYALRRFPS